MSSIKLLQSILDAHKIKAIVVNEKIGPRTTRYEVKLPMGVKIKSIKNIQEDIAMHLCVKNIRIAPVSENGMLGIEIENGNTGTISAKEILSSYEFQTSNSELTFALGKGIAGNIIIGDIRELIHLLIAGQAGAGKSVFMNLLITSLIKKSNPKCLELLLIDPKQVEFNRYNDLPHLIAPVITDNKKAIKALKKMVDYMNNRYEFLKKEGFVNIYDFNNRPNRDSHLRPLVIIIDELSDLMMSSNREVQEPIIKLAQKGRAAGIHLVIATQYPKAEVVTGLIKANMPSKIAFAVSAGVHSRVILDKNGAENLLGKGDMLYHPVGEMNSIRLQGAYISCEETETILREIKNIEYENNHMKELIDELESKNSFQGFVGIGGGMYQCAYDMV